MPTYFHGWRRKAGCMTLLMAGVFAAGWVRSQDNSDRFLWRSSDYSYEEIRSVDETLYWMTHRTSRDHDLPCPPMMRFETDLISALRRQSFEFHMPNDQMEWYVGRWRFGIGLDRDGRSEYPQILVRVVPYWSIAVPLAMLSAYLLISKPRNQPEKS